LEKVRKGGKRLENVGIDGGLIGAYACMQIIQVIVKSLEKHGFKKAGSFKGYYFIDDRYIDILTYAYP